ncbi:hypothetical protein [uncultured Porphyromonas sp.]|uniref:toxin-antitoxin system YwqK family antitoxin n=1 Tax=uncultured Porphyromonas sp. TaxID=159274 RepID=UPI00259BA16C|nr:hypothetical protein [uncultured Porphyromonas sp.]
MGYIGYSRSENSQRAINDYEVPKSMITRTFIQEFLRSAKFLEFLKEQAKSGNPMSMSVIENVPVTMWKDATEYVPYIRHHTSKFYNYTPHYDLLEVVSEVYGDLSISGKVPALSDGLFSCIDSDGKTIFCGMYQNGKLNGSFEWYGASGLQEHSFWRDGVLDGLCEKWHTNGQLAERCAYKDGNKDGLFEKWHSNGQLAERCTYKDGEFEGMHECWSRDGQLGSQWSYVNGSLNGLCLVRNEEGLLQKSVFYKDGKKHGLCESWHTNGQLKERCTYKDGNKDGLYTRWSLNGNLLVRCTYKNGVKDGLSEQWSKKLGKVVRHTFVEGEPSNRVETDGFLETKKKMITIAPKSKGKSGIKR